MQANTLIQLVGLMIQVGAGLYGFIQAVKYALERWGELQIKKIDASVKIAESNTLTASQVAEILTHYHHLKNEISTLKSGSEEKSKSLLHMIEEMDKVLDELYSSFQQFLITKALGNDHKKHSS